MRRVLLYDRFDSPVMELAEADVFGLVRKEVINGEHSLTITTTAVLQKGWRVLVQDGTGRWREFVVSGCDALHDSGARPMGTYYCVWSVQPDLMGTRVSAMPGVQTPVQAGTALTAALGGTSRWSTGTVTQTTYGGASMYDMDGWSALKVLVDNWGGELDTTITVGSSGVVSRAVCLYATQGDQTAKRRFDFGGDIRSVRRKMSDDPLYCRITPRGKGEETDTGGYGRKITIESVNDGKDYLENSVMVPIAKLPNGSGGWEYPTLEVENSECETPAQLKVWAQSVLDEYTLPKVTYEVDAMQASAEGVDAQGVSLGDSVQVVDDKFGEDVRLQGRVISLTVDMLEETNVAVTLGYLDDGMAGMIESLASSLTSVRSTVMAMNGGTMSTADYLTNLLNRLNMEINATGGYTYITQGQGLRTYDTAVSDPTVGAEASKVVEIKGGTIRIANTRTSGGEWDWKTLLVSGHIAAEMITTANITAGYIGSASGGNYWNLDTGVLRATTGTIGGFTIGQSALYNNRTSLTGSASGVYVGTNGIATGDGSHGIAMSDGVIAGYYGNNEVGRITTNAEFVNDGTTTRGIQLRSDVIDIRADKLLVKGDSSSQGDSTAALEDKTLYSTYWTINSYDASTAVVMRPTERRRRVVNGIVVSDTSYWYTPLGSSTEYLTLPTKAYVDGLISGLQSQINGKASRSELPSFSLSGNNLTITT